MTLYASADGPAVLLLGQTIWEYLTIKCQATYGRILFRPEVRIQNCHFIPVPASPGGRAASDGRGADR